MSLFDKHFTVAEARAALPELRRRLIRIHDLLAEVRARQERAGEAPVIILRGNGKGPIITQTAEGDQKQEAQRLIEEIAESGIQIKDLQQGLVDFPHFLRGDPSHEVFLCWHLGEDTIEFWHEIEAGYGGRQPL
jgi:hypothetical protein